MYPVVRTMTIMGLLTLTAFSLNGCGEKRLHVSTVSGAPGDQASLDATSQDTASSAQGIDGTTVDESNLSGSVPTALETASATHPTTTQSETPVATLPQAGAKSLQEGEGALLPEGSSLNTQSGSSPQDTAPLAFGDIRPSSLSDAGGAGDEMARLQPQDNLGQNSTSSIATSPLQETDPNMEEIPGTLQVAKAEPSDSLREQLDRMKNQELAAATAGLEDVFFQFDSWALTGEGKLALERNMGWLKNDPSATLLIEGHADQRGTQAYNMILAKKRAVAIRDYLNELGVDHSRLSVISYGKDKPFCQDPTEVCYQLNRRGHLLVQNPQ